MYTNDWDFHANTYVELPDVSNIEVNYQAIFSHIEDCSGKTILDYGCGEGRLSNSLEKMGAKVVGVDISLPIIELAKKKSGQLRTKVSFFHMNENNLDFINSGFFDIAISNLVFMMYENKQHIIESMKVINRVLKRNGRFIFVITHPCFIERGGHDYRNVFPEEGFIYTKESYPYKFILQDSNGNEIDNNYHDYHYMLSTYLKIMIQAGFSLSDIDELTYSKKIIEQYNIPSTYQTFPISVLVEARKN